MNNAYTPPSYPLEYRYATVITIAAEGLVFSGIFPLVILVLAVGLIAASIIDRFTVIYCYRDSIYDNGLDFLHSSALWVLAIAFMLR